MRGERSPLTAYSRGRMQIAGSLAGTTRWAPLARETRWAGDQRIARMSLSSEPALLAEGRAPEHGLRARAQGPCPGAPRRNKGEAQGEAKHAQHAGKTSNCTERTRNPM